MWEETLRTCINRLRIIDFTSVVPSGSQSLDKYTRKDAMHYELCRMKVALGIGTERTPCTAVRLVGGTRG